jgi:hypothetical protein
MDTSASFSQAVPPALWYITLSVVVVLLAHGFNEREMFSAQHRAETYRNYHAEKHSRCTCRVYTECKVHGAEAKKDPPEIEEQNKLAKTQLIAEKIRKKREQQEINKYARGNFEPEAAAERITSSSDIDEDD